MASFLDPKWFENSNYELTDFERIGYHADEMALIIHFFVIKFQMISQNRQNITETTFYDIIISSTDIESTEIPNDVFSTTDAICLDNSRPTFSQSCPDEFISQSEFSEVIFAICVSAIIMIPSITVAVMLILTSNAKNVKKQFEVKRRRSRAMSLVVYNRQGSIQ